MPDSVLAIDFSRHNRFWETNHSTQGNPGAVVSWKDNVYLVILLKTFFLNDSIFPPCNSQCQDSESGSHCQRVQSMVACTSGGGQSQCGFNPTYGNTLGAKKKTTLLRKGTKIPKQNSTRTAGIRKLYWVFFIFEKNKGYERYRC